MIAPVPGRRWLGTTTKVGYRLRQSYVTINSDAEGPAFYVFTQMGVAGGCAASQLEAIGRLVSWPLRPGVEVKAIIEQLRNIRCPLSQLGKKGWRIFPAPMPVPGWLRRGLFKYQYRARDHEPAAKLTTGGRNICLKKYR